jgi:CRP-like cAMP-binding protein
MNLRFFKEAKGRDFTRAQYIFQNCESGYEIGAQRMSLDQYLKKLPRGTVLVAEGDVVDGFYFLQKGVLERSVGGVPMTPDIKEPQVLGEVGYFAGGRRTVTLTVKEDCEVLYFRDINSLFHAVQKRQGFFDDLERRFVSRVNDSEFLLEEKKKMCAS